MNGDPQHEHEVAVPVRTMSPDPTVATNDAVSRAVRAERDYVDSQLAIRDERLRGIDKATELLSNTVNSVPTSITTAVDNIRTLMDEKFDSVEAVAETVRESLGERMAGHAEVRTEQFKSVQLQFAERDERATREARDNKLAVDAAFAAQEKQAQAESKANSEAIAKSERATAETIKTNQDLMLSKTDALTKSLDELKLAVAAIQAIKIGVGEQRTEQRAGQQANYGLIGAVAVVVGLVIAVMTFLIGRNTGATGAMLLTWMGA